MKCARSVIAAADVKLGAGKEVGVVVVNGEEAASFDSGGGKGFAAFGLAFSRLPPQLELAFSSSSFDQSICEDAWAVVCGPAAIGNGSRLRSFSAGPVMATTASGHVQRSRKSPSHKPRYRIYQNV